ncbi:hypothetical protein PsAD13_04969 [Pseudovibrio sp. Ad13]|nr:hypothetical protein PsAD13_04969 [Pseudovibrio sp. Ad13]
MAGHELLLAPEKPCFVTGHGALAFQHRMNCLFYLKR